MPDDRHKSAKEAGAQEKPGKLTKSLADNTALFKELFLNVDLVREREFSNAANPKARFSIMYTEGVVSSEVVNLSVIRPLTEFESLNTRGGMFEQIRDSVLQNNELRDTQETEQLVKALCFGDTLLFIDGFDRAIIIGSKNFTTRGITEPEGERVLSGPREGFTETIITNLSMVRRRLLTSDLKLCMRNMGKHSSTAVCIAYMDNIVNKSILAELYRRLEGVDLDAILDGNYISEYITEQSGFGFSTVDTTERPDVVVGKLMEGRIAIFTDGSPVVLTLPYLFIECFQTSEDYYMNPIYTSFSRALRMLCFALTCLVPAIYIATVSYHHELLPSSIIINFAAHRANAPLSAATECFLMLIIFDILRETGVRMPNHVGQAMSIVGALVIGQSAVEANLVAAPVVIIVAITGITILLVPRLTTAALISRYFCLILACMLGNTGVMVGVTVLIVHVLNLKSLGVPIVLQAKRLRFQEVKDIFIRAPWPKMLTRTRILSSNTVRQKRYRNRYGGMR